MSSPRKARLMLFVPRTDEALVASTYYANDEAQTDLRYQIKDDAGATVVTGYAGAAVLSYTITGLALVVGDVYSARIRHVNATGESAWGPAYNAQVYDPTVGGRPPTGDVPALPGSNPVPLTLAPSYRQESKRTRGLIETLTESGATIRRQPDLAEARHAKLVWRALTGSQKDATLDELRTAADEARAVQAPAGPEIGAELFLVNRGRILTRLTAPGTWEVTADVLEVSP